MFYCFFSLRLYHTQSVSSAIMCGKQLVLSGRSLTRIPHPPSSAGIKQSPAPVTLDKEDNSGIIIINMYMYMYMTVNEKTGYFGE